MDKFGRKGRYHTFKVLHMGVNSGTQEYERVEPSALFQAGQILRKDPTTERVGLCVFGDPGYALGFSGSAKTTAPALLALRERITVPATGFVKMKHPYIYDLSLGTAFVYNVTAGVFVAQTPDIDAVLLDPDTDLTAGLIAFADDVAAFTPTVGQVLEVSYYYRSLNEDKYPVQNDTAGSGAVTVWKQHGTYLTSQFEMLDNAGDPGFPAIGDPLYCSPQGKLTADLSTVALDVAAAAEILAICRKAPFYDDQGVAWMMFDARI